MNHTWESQSTKKWYAEQSNQAAGYAVPSEKDAAMDYGGMGLEVTGAEKEVRRADCGNLEEGSGLREREVVEVVGNCVKKLLEVQAECLGRLGVVRREEWPNLEQKLVSFVETSHEMCKFLHAEIDKAPDFQWFDDGAVCHRMLCESINQELELYNGRNDRGIGE